MRARRDPGVIRGRLLQLGQRTRAEEGDEADRWGRASRERSGRGLESDAGERRPVRGGASWAAALGQRWEGKEEEKAGKRAGPLRIAGLDFFFPFSFFFFKQTQTTLKLFEFKFEFEFNPSTQTNKTMHQHECTSMLNLDKFLITCGTKLD